MLPDNLRRESYGLPDVLAESGRKALWRDITSPHRRSMGSQSKLADFPESPRRAVKETRRHIVKCDSAESIPVPEVQHAELGIADAGCVCQHGLEHGFELAGRAGDRLQDLGAGRLLLQRLSSLPSCLGKLPPCLVSVTLRFRKLAGPGVRLLLQSFD